MSRQEQPSCDDGPGAPLWMWVVVVALAVAVMLAATFGGKAA